MSPGKMWKFVLIMVVILICVSGEAEGARRRKRRRRLRTHVIGGDIVQGQGNGTVSVNTEMPVRRIRHASSRRAEFVRRRLRKIRNRRRDYEGKIRLVDGRAGFEGRVKMQKSNIIFITIIIIS